MMSESVTVTVQDGSNAGRPGAGGAAKPGEPGQTTIVPGLTVNADYFRTIPGIIKLVQLEIKEEREEERASSSESREEKELTQEEIQLQEKRRGEWEKLENFLRTHSDQMIDAVSFNASTNLHTNDVANLDRSVGASICAESCKDYEERVSLIDLKTIEDRHLFSVSWHCELEDVIVCAYLDKKAKCSSLVALWSVLSPLRPKMILHCEEKIATISFCPLRNYTNVIVGGCVDGKVVVWEINRHLLVIEEDNVSVINKRVPVTCFCLPLAKNEESSSLSIRDQADLERLRKVFVGTVTGEVMCCSWESQTFSVDATDREVCRILTRCCVHDGVVRTMAKSPHLDDVFLTVGGRVFAVWKEDFAEAPIFERRSRLGRYGEGCWSGRSGMFVLARLDGCFEVWDLKRRSDEPVLLQTVSGKVTPCVYPNRPTSRDKLLAVLDGPSTLRVYAEPPEAAKDEDLVRVEWFEEFAWRETKRKLDFRRWQEEYLRQHPTALRRKAEREQAEVARRHREARERYLRVLGIICMACGSPGYGSGHWYLFVAASAFCLTLIWTLIYLFSIREAPRLKDLPINWIASELINTGLYTIFYFTAFVVELASAWYAKYIVAGIFGIFNTIAYAAGSYFLYLEYKNSQQ